MRNFLKTTSYFILFIVVIAFLLQAFISLRIKNKCITGHDNLDQNTNVNAELVFLGSSRCAAHFDPYFFTNTFNVKSVNIGVDGHSELSMAIVRLQDYITRNKNPKYAILSFDPFMAGGSIENNTNLIHKNDFAGYSFWPRDKDLLMLNYFKFNFWEKNIPLFAIFKYGLLGDCLHIKLSNYSKYGYDFHEEYWDTISKPITNEIVKNYFDNKEIPSIKKRLGDLNTLCLKNNIKLICIQTPVYKILFSEVAFNKTSQICRELNIPFIDILKITNIQNNINNFYNSNHMNRYGVTKMNEFLKSDSNFQFFLNREIK